MKTPPPTRPPAALPDWLNDCSFQSREESLGSTPGILAHNVKKSTAPTSFHREFASGAAVTALGEHGLVSMPSQNFVPVLESTITSTTPPAKSENNEVLSELRTLRQLSAGVFDPHSERDFLPELILFGVIGVLCAAWPIVSMLTVMASRH